MSSLTHTLTHTGKSPYGISETRSTRKDVEGEGKGMKMPLHRHLKGLGTLRNQQVARSSRVTSSRKKWLPDSGAFFHSGASGFATCAKPAPAGDFPLRSDVVGTYDSPTNAPSLSLATRSAKSH